MVKAFNFGVPGFASLVLKDNDEALFTDSDVEDISNNSLRKIIVKVSKLVSHVRK